MPVGGMAVTRVQSLTAELCRATRGRAAGADRALPRLPEVPADSPAGVVGPFLVYLAAVMTLRRVLLPTMLIAFTATAGEKPCIVYKAPPSSEDERPVATSITVGPQGSDYAFKVDFNKEPWGESCKTRCANATIFLDTDNNKSTGLKLLTKEDGKEAPESGADLAVTIQGLREYKDQSSVASLKVKVKQYSEDSTSAEQGTELVEMDVRRDSERLNPADKTIYLLVDANVGSLPSNPKIRVIYHPPDSKPLVGYAKGLNAPGANRVEIFKDGKLTNPVKKKKKDYEAY
jgi:hypothetical protein